MNGWIIVLINIAVAGTVGGITNHLAIRMLFRPRRPIYIGRLKVPFTPGLFPKRRQEIADALGHVVAEYLVTPQGLQEMLSQDEFRQAVNKKLVDWVERHAGPGITIGDLLSRWFGEQRAKDWLRQAPVQAAQLSGQALAAIWARGRWGERLLQDAVPGWSDEHVRRWAEAAASIILSSLERRLVSDEGQKLLRKLAVGLMDRSGGFIGMLAGIFIDEDKLIARLTPFLLQQLDSQTVRDMLTEMIENRLREWGETSLDELWADIAAVEEPLQLALQRWVREKLPWEDWVGRIEAFPLGEWLAERKEQRDQWLSRLAAAGLNGAQMIAPRIIRAIRLPELVRTQVERFPVERLEQLILDVSGKEFKAITWLGVLLGGLIGLIQSITLLLWR